MKRKPLSTDNMKVVFGGTFGDPAPKSKLKTAIDQADELDTIRRREKPTRDELAAAAKSGDLSESDAEHLRRLALDMALPAGRPADSKNATLARDGLIYFEFGKLLGKGLEKPVAEARVGKMFGLGTKAVQAALTRTRKLYAKPRKAFKQK
ncbi:hypothetical protein [Thiobacillus sp.]|uniref:hypothetical protein n=1 Tax=Thiobacillus sp. TaxID=924 RepID=UPI00286E86C8|nr:hypothetical protein [Thiobacillus sp.]